MSTWATPITFVSAATLTAAQLNGTRDNLLHLKGALDLLTNGTTADTGTAMLIDLEMTAATTVAVATRVSGDAFPRFEVRADGQMHWLTSTTGDVEQFLDPNPTIRRMIFKGLTGGVTPTNNQVAVELAAIPGSANALFVWANGDSFPRIGLGTDASSRGTLSFGSGTGAQDVTLWRSAASELTISAGRTEFGGDLGTIGAGNNLFIGSSNVVGARMTGWTAPTGTTSRSTFDTATVTLVQLATKVKALLEDLGSTSGHGLIDV